MITTRIVQSVRDAGLMENKDFKGTLIPYVPCRTQLRLVHHMQDGAVVF
jgi:hypothetical protein